MNSTVSSSLSGNTRSLVAILYRVCFLTLHFAWLSMGCRQFCICVQTLLAILCFSIGTFAAEGNPGDQIRVITYNVQFLPDPASFRNERPEPEYRADQIAKQVSRFDVVALQETFHDKHRARIVEGIGKVWKKKLHTVASPTPKEFFTSGGCLLVSKTPFAVQHTTVFANFSKPADYGLRADGYAAKGVLHARVLRNAERNAENGDDFVDVFVTHLEARADNLRPLQYAEIATFVKKHSSADHPVLLLGDLNTRGSAEFRTDRTSQYSQLMEQLASAHAGRDWIDVWPHLQADSLGGTNKQESADIGKRIDYILLSNPMQSHTQLVPISVAVKLFQDAKVTALSDHNAVAAVLEWR